MKTLSDFYQRLLPYLPGCPEPVANQVLVDSAIEFCEQSDALRETLDPLVTSPSVSTYELDTPSQQQVTRVTRVGIGGSDLQVMVTDNPAALPTRLGRPTHYYVTRNASVFEMHLYPTPDAAYTLSVEAALRPVRSATSLTDDLFNYWLEPVIAGAMARAMTMPNQPFTDPERASSAAAAAMVGANKARRVGSVGRVRGSLHVNARPAA